MRPRASLLMGSRFQRVGSKVPPGEVEETKKVESSSAAARLLVGSSGRLVATRL